jgi:hypothetical protein
MSPIKLESSRLSGDLDFAWFVEVLLQTPFDTSVDAQPDGHRETISMTQLPK